MICGKYKFSVVRLRSFRLTVKFLVERRYVEVCLSVLLQSSSEKARENLHAYTRMCTQS